MFRKISGLHREKTDGLEWWIVGMAFIQYLVFDGMVLPLPDSYEVAMKDVEADSGGETEAGTAQRDVVWCGWGW